MSRYLITYTSTTPRQLDSDFWLDEIMANSLDDASLIVYNIENWFKGITVECVEEEKKCPKRRRINSDRRKSA